MKDIYRIAETDTGLTPEEIKTALLASLEGRSLKNTVHTAKIAIFSVYL